MSRPPARLEPGEVFLDSAAAAAHCGYRVDRKGRAAFMRAANRDHVRAYWIGSRPRFLARDLDRWVLSRRRRSA